MKKALIVAGGYLHDLEYLNKIINTYEIVAAVDRGLDYLVEINYIPGLLVGDMDSCHPESLKRAQYSSCQIITLPCEKDATDLEVALDLLVEAGYQHIDVVAALQGARIDHLLGAIILLPKYVRQQIEVRLIGPRGRIIQVLDKAIVVEGTRGTYVSLLPLTRLVKGVTTKGLKYPLTAAILCQGQSLGVSNELSQERAHISLSEGLLLVIKEEDK